MTSYSRRNILFAMNTLLIFVATTSYLLFSFDKWTGSPMEADFVTTFPDSRSVSPEDISPITASLYPTLYYASHHNKGYFRPTGEWWALTFSVSLLLSSLFALLPSKLIGDTLFIDEKDKNIC